MVWEWVFDNSQWIEIYFFLPRNNKNKYFDSMDGLPTTTTTKKNAEETKKILFIADNILLKPL